MASFETMAEEREASLSGSVASASFLPGTAPAGQREARALRDIPTGPALPGEAQPRPQGAPERHLRLVPPRQRRRLRRRLSWYGLVAGVLAVCFGLVGLHVVIAEAQFRIDRLQQQASAEQARYEKLRLLVAELEAPARIVSVAEGELGMRQPASVSFLPAPKVAGGQAGISGGGSGGGAAGAGTRSQGRTVPAPTGDADWPSVKPYLSGTP